MHAKMGRLLIGISLSVAGFAQEQTAQSVAPAPPATESGKAPGVAITAGTRVPLVMINSISTKHATVGDRLYLETTYPVVINNRIIIPPGSYVSGTITDSKRAGRVKGKAELYLRFDSLTLPNGVTREFRARPGGLDGRSSESLSKEEGKIIGDSSKGEDLGKIGTLAGTGASVGTIAGSASGSSPMKGLGMGAAAGAAAGVAMVLLTRGNDIVLGRGTVVEMVLDRDMEFSEAELDFSGTSPKGASNFDGGPTGKKANTRQRLPGSTGIPGTVF